VLAPGDPRLEVEALGLTFASPLGVAAGLDKEAECFAGLGDLGFGHVEVGTVTARAQAGNPQPRVGRLPRDRALYNRMGFPNPGASAFAQRLAGRPRHVVVGVNVGKSMDVELADAAADYRATVRLLAPLADYLVINVSSPNTPGLRSMQSVDELRGLVDAVRDELRAIGHAPPLLVKIAPDLADAEIDAIADYAVETGLDGLVAVNTTIDDTVLDRSTAEERAAVYGGISGAPLKRRAVEVLRRLRARAGDDLVLISVGGIENADDAWERLAAGATLVQAYTGFVYGGPLWPRRINRQLARRAAGRD
jgi:dihydroorotate dehydrogenase